MSRSERPHVRCYLRTSRRILVLRSEAQMARKSRIPAPLMGDRGMLSAFRYIGNKPCLGCSRRDLNPRYGVEGPESLTGLDYGSTVPPIWPKPSGPGTELSCGTPRTIDPGGTTATTDV